MVAALHWSQFKAAADFCMKYNMEVLKTNGDAWMCKYGSV